MGKIAEPLYSPQQDGLPEQDRYWRRWRWQKHPCCHNCGTPLRPDGWAYGNQGFVACCKRPPEEWAKPQE